MDFPESGGGGPSTLSEDLAYCRVSTIYEISAVVVNRCSAVLAHPVQLSFFLSGAETPLPRYCVSGGKVIGIWRRSQWHSAEYLALECHIESCLLEATNRSEIVDVDWESEGGVNLTRPHWQIWQVEVSALPNKILG